LGEYSLICFTNLVKHFLYYSITGGLWNGQEQYDALFSQTIFDLADYLVSNILLLLGVFYISLFVPYKIPKNKLLEELSIGTK
jgi:NSS family neurotransmitter:Na+ symporter